LLIKKIIVISIDYRLSPESKFPDATEDFYSVLLWLANKPTWYLQHIDLNKIIVGGESAGGNLAAVVCLMARDRKAPVKIAHQLLVYPAFFIVPEPPSMRENKNTFFLNERLLHWFAKQYLPNEGAVDNPYINPMKSATLSGLPPAHIITAEGDPLRDDGKIYAEELKTAGVRCIYDEFKHMFHGFFIFNFVHDANIAFKQSLQQMEHAL